jgi:uncharacterized protein YggE
MSGAKQRGRAGVQPPARSDAGPETTGDPHAPDAPDQSEVESQKPEETNMMPVYGSRTQPQEGIAVVGEAVRRVAPESAEFLIEIAAGGHTASQAMHDHQTKTTHIAQAVSTLGVQRADLQTISLNMLNVYAPLAQALPYGVPQIPPGGIAGFAAPAALQSDVQFGMYQARSVVRVNVREAVRAGEIADALVKAGATVAGGLAYRTADEAGARKSVLEAAGKDARAKAEILAGTAGKKLGDPLAISEDIIASNGVYSAMRAQMPWAFGPDTPSTAGELEYYARVTATFRFQ